ncbi:acyl carrier protein [Leuconostocaceae bacterium ESL0958]|nr:acyl carrier protein [Leuconostocaceae bacterium ESL0958]
MKLSKDVVYDRLAAEVAKRFSLSPEQIKPDLHFVNEVGTDSIDMVELALEVEDEFDMDIPDGDLEQLDTLGKVADYVYEYQGQHLEQKKKK